MNAPQRTAPTDARQCVSDAAASGVGGRAGAAAPSRSAHSTHGLASAVRLMVAHGRLAAAAAAGGDPKLKQRLLLQQGETLLLAGLQLLDEGGAG